MKQQFPQYADWAISAIASYALKKHKNLSPHTIKYYKIAANGLESYAGSGLKAREVTADLLAGYRSKLEESNNEKTTERMIDAIKAIVSFAGCMTDHKKTPLKSYVDEFYLPVLKPDAVKQTRSTVRKAAEEFVVWFGDDVPMQDIQPVHVDHYLDECSKSITQAERIYLLSVLRSFAPSKFMKKSAVAKALPAADGPQLLLTAFYSQVYEPNALRSRRPNTKRLYRTTLHKFTEFIGRVATLDDLNDETINGFAAWRTKQKLSKHSVNKDLFNLLALWRWAHKKGYVENYPDVEMEKAPKRTPVAWTQAEISKLFSTCNGLSGSISGVPAATWWLTLLSVCWDTAERISAVMSLKWSDVDIADRWVRFDAEYRKGGRADNLRRIAKDTSARLNSMKKYQDNYDPESLVFNWPYSKTSIYTKLEGILKKAGLPHDAKSKFHRIRKTAASFYEKAGGNATELLGHTKRETTAAYLDPRIVERPEAVDLLFRPLIN